MIRYRGGENVDLSHKEVQAQDVEFLLLLCVIGQRKTESYKTNLNKII